MITSKLRHTYTPNPQTKTPDVGLANRLFQIAAGIGYGKKYGEEAVFPDILHKNYEIHRDTIFRNLNFNGGLKDFIENQYSFQGYGYQEIPYKPNLEINGWFQSWKYFSNAELEVKKAFSPSEEMLKYLNLNYSKILNNKKTVSIHIRRGIQASNKSALR